MEFVFFSASGTGIAQSALDTVLAAWGVPGIVAVLAVGAVIWWTRATSGLRAEQETTITRQNERIKDLVAQLERSRERADKFQESYLAVRYPRSGYKDVVEGTDLEIREDE